MHACITDGDVTDVDALLTGVQILLPARVPHAVVQPLRNSAYCWPVGTAQQVLIATATLVIPTES